MAWQQLTLRIDAADLPRTESLLRLAGAESVSICDAGDNPILEPEPGTVPLWPELTVRALFPENLKLDAIGTWLGIEPESPPERIGDDAFDRALRQTVKPLTIGPRLRLVPAEDFAPQDPRSLGLHMGLAFGTGQHPTTRLCLEWLERNQRQGGRVLDYGCGTGVLALAALQLGADSAVAVDNEPQALAAARRNAALNGFEARLTIGEPGTLGTEAFDVILANILAQPLLDLAEVFAAHHEVEGRLVLSGILETQLDVVETHYGQWYGELERDVRGGWGLLTGTRRSGV